MLTNKISSKKNLKWWVYSATGLILIVLWGVVFQNVWHSWQGAVNTEKVVSQNLARSLAAHTSATLGYVNYRLENIKNSLIQTESLPRFSKLGTEIIKESIFSSELIFAAHYFDAEGDIHQSSILIGNGERKLPKELMNVADKGFFQKLKLSPYIENNGFHIGRPYRDKITDELILPVAKAVYTGKDIFSGVVMAAIRIQYFENLYESLEIYKGSSVALSRKDGVFLVRTPFNPLFFSKDFSENIFFSHIIKVEPSGHFEDSSSIDGHIRLISFHSVPKSPLCCVSNT